MAKNPDFERKHPRNADGEFREKAGGSGPRWMQDIDAKIEAEQKRRDAARQPGYVPERRTAAQQFAAAASTPSERDVRGTGNPDFGRALAVEAATPRKPSGLPQRRHAGDAVRDSAFALARDTSMRVDPVVSTGLQGVMARLTVGEFPLDRLPVEVAVFAVRTRGRGRDQDADLLRRLSLDLDQIITGQRREDLATRAAPDRFSGDFPWRGAPAQHPGTMVNPTGWL